MGAGEVFLEYLNGFKKWIKGLCVGEKRGREREEERGKIEGDIQGEKQFLGREREGGEGERGGERERETVFKDVMPTHRYIHTLRHTHSYTHTQLHTRHLSLNVCPRTWLLTRIIDPFACKDFISSRNELI